GGGAVEGGEGAMKGIVALAVALLVSGLVMSAETVHWPGFRGPEARGIADAKLPLSWNADPAAGAPRNVRWKTPVPGLAHSSPAIWGNRLFVTTAISSAGAAPL